MCFETAALKTAIEASRPVNHSPRAVDRCPPVAPGLMRWSTATSPFFRGRSPTCAAFGSPDKDRRLAMSDVNFTQSSLLRARSLSGAEVERREQEERKAPLVAGQSRRDRRN
jgi:hypothetical protein